MRSYPVVFLALLAAGAALAPGLAMSAPLCSEAWYREVERQVMTGDAQAHGPDVGSEEWKSAVEFKLGIRGDPKLPRRDGEGWCRYIDRVVSQHGAGSSRSASAAGTAPGPSYACDRSNLGSIEAMICNDQALAALDRKLAGVYATAAVKAANAHPPHLKAEQRGWIKGRNECWKSDDQRECVRTEYLHRIAELQARYRLVAGSGPIRYECDGQPASEVVVTLFQTDPPTLIAERGDSVSMMYLRSGTNGVSYQGRNESLREDRGETRIIWGYGAAEMRCTKQPWGDRDREPSRGTSDRPD